ncbi:MAG: hypothetical protein QXX08_07320 [Candidatus Bathyarchaeia archaeon]
MKQFLITKIDNGYLLQTNERVFYGPNLEAIFTMIYNLSGERKPREIIPDSEQPKDKEEVN